MNKNNEKIVASDLKELVEQFVDNLNKIYERKHSPKFYEVTIVKGTRKLNVDGTIVTDKNAKVAKTRPAKILKFYAHDLDTKERLTIYEDVYCPSNPAAFLSGKYIGEMYYRLLSNCLTNFAVSVENHVRTEQMKKAAELVAKRNYTETPEESFKPEDV